MAQYTTYDVVGVKEDVSDVISNISPTKTPFQSMIGSEKSTQKKFDWQEDTLRDVQDNNQAEGFTADDVALSPTTMRSNICQIMAETIKISASEDNTDNYGRAKESAYQIAKTSAALKRDLENAFVGTAQAKVVPTTNLTNRKMAGFQAQLLNGGSAALDADDSVIYTGGTGTVPDEDDLVPLLQQLYENGADPSVIMVTPRNSRVVADFAKVTGRYRTIESSSSAADQKTIINVVNLYVSPFGEQKVVLNRFQRAKNTLVFEPSMWKKVVFRNWTRETLAKTGDNTAQMIVGEFSLKHKAFAASGAIVEAAGPTGF